MARLKIHKPSEAVYHFCGPKYRCAYCGDLADTIDHTVPRWFVSGNLEIIKRYRLVKVSACKSCNVLAANKIDATFRDRKKRISKKLVKRAWALLQTGGWVEDELEEIGRGLEDYIREANENAAWVRRRLEFLRDPLWPEGVPDDLFIDTKQKITSMQDTP